MVIISNPRMVRIVEHCREVAQRADTAERPRKRILEKTDKLAASVKTRQPVESDDIDAASEALDPKFSYLMESGLESTRLIEQSLAKGWGLPELVKVALLKRQVRVAEQSENASELVAALGSMTAIDLGNAG